MVGWDQGRDIWAMYSQGYIPHNTIIDMDGIVRYTNYGFNLTNIINQIEASLDKPPSKPTGLIETDVTGNSITVEWDPNIEQDLDGYELTYITWADNSNRTVVDVGDVTTYTLTDLLPDAEYQIWLKAYDNRGYYSDKTRTLFVTTLADVPELSHVVALFLVFLLSGLMIVSIRRKQATNL